MLADFIAANSLKARILPYPAKGRIVRCRLFSSPSCDVLAVYFSDDKISLEKLKALLKSDIIEHMGLARAEDITGYEAEFMPPISIYGIKVVVDRKVMESENVKCLVSEEKTLEISPKEILEANDDALEADITL